MAARLGSKVEVFKTGCQMCHGGCGIIVHVENERRQIIIAKEHKLLTNRKFRFIIHFTS